MNINENAIHFNIQGGGVTIKVVGHSGEGAVLGPTLEIKSQMAGHTLGFSSIHMKGESLRELANFLHNEADKFDELKKEGACVEHPFAVSSNILNKD